MVIVKVKFLLITLNFGIHAPNIFFLEVHKLGLKAIHALLIGKDLLVLYLNVYEVTL